MSGTAPFIAGLAIFFGAHLYSAFRSRGEASIEARIGRLPYRGAYAVVSFLGLALLIHGYADLRGAVPVWDPPLWTRHLALTLMAPAIVLFVAAECPTGKIKATLKHPMLVGVKIWAISHLAANGDAASIILFGAFLAFAVIDRIMVKRREAPPMPPATAKGDIIAVVVGAGLYLAIVFYGHEWLIGVPIMY